MGRSLTSIEVSAAARFFKALGDENRLRIVALLAHGELCVCHIETALKLNQPTASRLLAVLRTAGVITSRRQGNWMHYRLAPQADALCKRHLQVLARTYGNQPRLRADVVRLQETMGPGALQ